MSNWSPSMIDIFGLLADKMQSYFNRTKRLVGRPDEKGIPREEVVFEFFKEFMPSNIGVSKGYIINLNGDYSNECDIILHRKNSSPILKISPTQNIHIIPIEDVYGVIEVKSKLTNKEIENCVKKQQSLVLCNQRRLVDETEHYHLPPYEAEEAPSATPPFFAVFCYAIDHHGIDDFWVELHDHSSFDAVYCFEEGAYTHVSDSTTIRHYSLKKGITGNASSCNSASLDNITARICMPDYYERSYSDFNFDAATNGELLMIMYAYINDHIENAELESYSISDYIALWKNKRDKN